MSHALASVNRSAWRKVAKVMARSKATANAKQPWITFCRDGRYTFYSVYKAFALLTVVEGLPGDGIPVATRLSWPTPGDQTGWNWQPGAQLIAPQYNRSTRFTSIILLPFIGLHAFGCQLKKLIFIVNPLMRRPATGLHTRQAGGHARELEMADAAVTARGVAAGIGKDGGII